MKWSFLDFGGLEFYPKILLDFDKLKLCVCVSVCVFSAALTSSFILGRKREGFDIRSSGCR